MRFLFRPSVEQRAALQEQLTRVRQPAAILELLGPILPVGFRAGAAVTECAELSVHPDRFVVRVRLRAPSGAKQVYVLKAYADDFAERVWAYARSLTPYRDALPGDICLPIHHLPLQRMLVFPWVAGRPVTEHGGDEAPAMLRGMAELTAAVHRLTVVPPPEPPTTVAMILEEAWDRCRRVRDRWPDVIPVLAPLLADLEDAANSVDPADPAPVHGDLDTAQTLWTGERVVLLDLDMFGYTDPAYDVGHCLAQMERRNAPPAWLEAFRDSYLAANPSVSARNVSFYRALTLTRKIHTECRLHPLERATRVPQLAARAREALRDCVSPAAATP